MFTLIMTLGGKKFPEKYGEEEKIFGASKDGSAKG
jgi:hypothetical protein